MEAHRANALLEAHQYDPEFGYRFLVDEAAGAGEPMAARTAWRICSQQGWWSAFGKPKRGKAKRPGPPVHEDLVAYEDGMGRIRHRFDADAPNQLWLTDIAEHRTGEGKLYLCAIKDVFSNRIVGYSVDSRMKSRLAVAALNNAVARRGDVAGCIVHSDRGSQFRSRNSSTPATATTWSDRWAGSARPATTPPSSRSSLCFRRTSLTGRPGPPASSCGSRSCAGPRGPTTGDAGRTHSDG